MCAGRDGTIEDVLLGCPTLTDYSRPHPHFNCIVGRYSNRITNAQFQLAGETYELEANVPPHTLQGGSTGFANRLWKGEQTGSSVRFRLVSHDGDGGFPGELSVEATYTLNNRTLRLEITATTTKPTPVSLTQHHYFNLSGRQGSAVDEHVVQLHASRYLPISDALTQLGQLSSVGNTPFDFRAPQRLGDRLFMDDSQLKLAGGFDHSFLMDEMATQETAVVVEPNSGRQLRVSSNQPCVQFYTGNSLRAAGKNNVIYQKHQGFCLETQQFPDSPNQPNYPDAILYPGESFVAVTEFELTVS